MFRKPFATLSILALLVAGIPFADAAALTVSNQYGQNHLIRSEELDLSAVWAETNTTVQGNNVQAPDGTMTADTIFETVDGAPASHQLSQSSQNVPGIFTTSGYFKAINGTWMMLATDGGGAYQFYNIVTCTLGTVHVGAPWISASIVPVGNGWCRVSITATVGATEQTRIYLGSADGTFSYTGTGIAHMAAWGLQVVRGTVAGAYNKTVGGYINSNYIPTGATNSNQLGQNQLAYSEQIDNAAWTKDGLTVSPNVIPNPIDGKMTADKIVETVANGNHRIYQAPTALIGVQQTFSAYVKAAERTWVYMVSSADVLSSSVFFDIGNGVVGSTGGTPNAKIVPVGNGWYRISATFTQTSVISNVLLNTAQDGSTLSYAGDVTKGVYVWGVQVSVGKAFGAYNPTAASLINAAYRPSGTTQSSQLGQNLITNSEQINNWSTGGGAVVTANAAMAPDGTRTADQIDYTVAMDGYVYSGTGVMPTHTVGAKYTGSIWLWSCGAGKTIIGIRTYTMPGVLSGTNRTVNLTTTPTRYSVVTTLASAVDTGIILDLENRVGNGSDGVAGTLCAWGAQMVVGDKPGAYNPATASTVNPNYVP